MSAAEYFCIAIIVLEILNALSLRNTRLDYIQAFLFFLEKLALISVYAENTRHSLFPT